MSSYSLAKYSCDKVNDKMKNNQNESKPADRRKKVEPTVCSNQKSTSTFVYSVLKKITVVSVIYCVGYWNWSISWLITSIILAETRDYLMDTNVVRRKIAKASAAGRERETILACVKDLPSWVNQILCYDKSCECDFKTSPYLLGFFSGL